MPFVSSKTTIQWSSRKKTTTSFLWDVFWKVNLFFGNRNPTSHISSRHCSFNLCPEPYYFTFKPSFMFTFHVNYEILGEIYTKGVNVKSNSLSDLEKELKLLAIPLDRVIYIHRKSA